MPDAAGTIVDPTEVLRQGALADRATLEAGNAKLLGWLKEGEEEGDRINQSDPSYVHYALAQRVIGGETPRSNRGASYLPHIKINQYRKVIQTHIAALTDLRPLFGFQTLNPALSLQAHVLNQRVTFWWVNTSADVALGEVITYSLAGGSGDATIEWDPRLRENLLIARDPRDTLPFRPSTQKDLQLWRGVTLRDEYSVNALKAKFPTYAEQFRPSRDSILDKVAGRFRRTLQQLNTPADTLSGLRGQPHTRPMLSGGVVLRRTYVADPEINMTGAPVTMGQPGTAWAYVVQPQDPLYPYKRLIVWTDDLVLYDGPPPDWHGLYPVARLSLWSLPWQFLGLPLLNDVYALGEAIEDTANDIRVGIKKWTDPTVIMDRNAVSEGFRRTYDPRRPGSKGGRVMLNPNTAGEGFRHQDGPNPAVLNLARQFMGDMLGKFNDLTATANLEQLMTLRQLPSGDTLRQYQEALTPEIRHEGRQLEVFLRTPAAMVKSNLFQYETRARRMVLSGDAGLALDTLDIDPDTFVPAMEPGQEGYIGDLDASIPRQVRARFVSEQLVFMIAPNSILAIHAQEQKMLRLQLARMGVLDFWSLMEALEIGNVGQPPLTPLPLMEEVDSETILQQLQTSQNPGGKYLISPDGTIMEIRRPITIPERLIAQNTLGIGQTDNPAGRKASGQRFPQQEQKTDANGVPRTTVTEAGRQPTPDAIR